MRLRAAGTGTRPARGHPKVRQQPLIARPVDHAGPHHDPRALPSPAHRLLPFELRLSRTRTPAEARSAGVTGRPSRAGPAAAWLETWTNIASGAARGRRGQQALGSAKVDLPVLLECARLRATPARCTIASQPDAAAARSARPDRSPRDRFDRDALEQRRARRDPSAPEPGRATPPPRARAPRALPGIPSRRSAERRRGLMANVRLPDPSASGRPRPRGAACPPRPARSPSRRRSARRRRSPNASPGTAATWASWSRRRRSRPIPRPAMRGKRAETSAKA